MKKFLLIILTLFTISAGAQIVNIPDPVFKQGLLNAGYITPAVVRAYNSAGTLMIVDANNDDEIQASEAEAVWNLDLSTTFDIVSLEGIAAFSNLRKLNCAVNDIQTIDVTALTFLEELICNSQNGPGLTSVNVSGLQYLEKITCNSNEISNLNLTNVPSLKFLNCDNNFISNLDLAGKPDLEELRCGSNNLVNLNASDKPNLKKVSCQANDLQTVNFSNTSIQYLAINNNNLNSLDLSAYTSLIEVTCSYNPLQSLNVSGLVNLKILRCTNTSLSTLNVDGLNAMTNLEIQYSPNISNLSFNGNQQLTKIFALNCGLETISFTNLPSLSEVRLHNNSIEQLDFSTCPNISSIMTPNNPLQFVNLKNGALNDIYLPHTANYTELAYICIDDIEADYFTTAAANYPEINFNSYCSVDPGGNYNSVTGTIKFDYNNDGCDELDNIANFMVLSITDGNYSGNAYTGNNGTYSFYTYENSVTITPQFPNGWFTATPASAVVSFADEDTVNQNFCITSNGLHPDLEIVIVPINPAQPGFDAMYKIIYRNKGNQNLSGEVTFNYEEAVLDFVSASPAEASLSAGSITWAYSELLPYQTREIVVVLNVNGPMETPPVNNDDVIFFSAAITPAENDETPEDNNFGFEQIVVGSYDPNDIACLEGNIVSPDKIGEYLHYNINFENTGTFPATFIVVKDEINEDQFDISTLQLLYASHDVEVRVQGNKVEFYFDDIQLDPLEKGNVVFKIKTKNTLEVNDDVTQQANIFFDYNWPIETNEATTIFQVLSTDNFEVDNSVKMYPNPAEGVLNITADNSITSIQLYDIQGRLLQAVSPDDIAAKLDVSSRAAGIYFIKIATETGMKVEKLVKK